MLYAFVEFLNPIFCCAVLNGFQAGVGAGPIEFGLGSINKQQSDGQIEHDTFFAQTSLRLWRNEEFSAGIFAEGSFNPTPERYRPRAIDAGPWISAKLLGPIKIKLDGLPGSRQPVLLVLRWQNRWGQ